MDTESNRILDVVRKFKEHAEENMDTTSSVVFADVDASKNPQLVRRFGLDESTLPTMMLLRQGRLFSMDNNVPLSVGVLDTFLSCIADADCREATASSDVPAPIGKAPSDLVGDIVPFAFLQGFVAVLVVSVSLGLFVFSSIPSKFVGGTTRHPATHFVKAAKCFLKLKSRKM